MKTELEVSATWAGREEVETLLPFQWLLLQIIRHIQQSQGETMSQGWNELLQKGMDPAVKCETISPPYWGRDRGVIADMVSRLKPNQLFVDVRVARGASEELYEELCQKYSEAEVEEAINRIAAAMKVLRPLARPPASASEHLSPSA